MCQYFFLLCWSNLLVARVQKTKQWRKNNRSVNMQLKYNEKVLLITLDQDARLLWYFVSFTNSETVLCHAVWLRFDRSLCRVLYCDCCVKEVLYCFRVIVQFYCSVTVACTLSRVATTLNYRWMSCSDTVPYYIDRWYVLTWYIILYMNVMFWHGTLYYRWTSCSDMVPHTIDERHVLTWYLKL